jgi:XTP/dITP diphosphohydrolase
VTQPVGPDPVGPDPVGPDPVGTDPVGTDPVGTKVIELVGLMDRLRSPGGCPWDAKQTHASLVEYLIEESYETVEAIESQDRDGLREELGDLLLQVAFHARIAQEDEVDPWGIDEVAQGIIDKLIRRHPHVFADQQAGSDAELEASWHALKAAEKGRASVTDGIPASLPALLLASKVLNRTVGFADELGPFRYHQAALDALDSVTDQEGLGEVMLAMVAIAREQGWDAEAAVRSAVRHRMQQVQALEQGIVADE